MNMNIKLLTSTALKPTYATNGSAAVDLYSDAVGGVILCYFAGVFEECTKRNSKNISKEI